MGKKKINQVGYQSGTKVTRRDTSNGRKQEGYWTYSFKAFTTERQPNNTKAKGFMERTFVLSCTTGNPQYDITEVINPAGDKRQIELFEELSNIRIAIKVHRSITHYTRLKGQKPIELWKKFKKPLESIDKKILFWLFQMPSVFKCNVTTYL
jgi:hypothetical protein